MSILIPSITYFVELIQLLILIRIFLSYIIRDPYNPIYKIIYQVTEPILLPFRNLIARLGIKTGMIDFSPLLAMFSIYILAQLLIRILWLALI